MNLELKNQHFQLTHNSAIIADLLIDAEGCPRLFAFKAGEVRMALAVLTLIVGEYPTPEAAAEIVLDIRPAPRTPRERKPLNLE